MIKTLRVSELKPHPENNYYFDDMVGDKWTDFLESIKDRGVIEPIIITDENVIVSGHQRVRACKEVGVEEIMCDVRHYDSQSAVIRDLLETNLMQRGEIISGYIKKSRILETMRQFYGVKNGGNRGNQYTKNKTDEVAECAMHNLADKYEVVKDKLHLDDNGAAYLMRFAKLIPELQEAVDDDKLPFSIATRLLHKLTADEQQQLLDMLPERKVTGKEIQQYVNQITAKDAEIEKLKAQKEAADQEAQKMREEAVEAVRQVNGSKDAEKYQQMKEARDKAVQESRNMYEENQRLRKEKDTLIENVHKTNEEVNKRVRKLEDELRSALDRAEAASEPVVETVEVIPDDYEELKEKAALYDERFKEVVFSNRESSLTQEEASRNSFIGRITNSLEAFLPQVRGLVIDKKMLGILTCDERKNYINTSNCIIEQLNKLIKELNVEVA